MRLFGRSKATGNDPRWRGWPESLDVHNSVDVNWIKQSGDPLVWHTAALACLIFVGDPHGLIAWLVQQPNLDRVTAAAIFLHGGNGVRRLENNYLNIVKMEDPQVQDMIDRLCDLDGSRVLADHGIGLDPGWESTRLETVARLRDNPRAPKGILSRPIDRQTAKMPYSDIGEGELVSEKFLRENMPYLFD